MPIDDNKYFLVIPEIKLCPELNDNPIKMIEQVMNAYIISNYHNVRDGIKHVITLEYFCQDFLEDDFRDVLERIRPMLEKHNLHIAQGEEVRGYYPMFYDSSKYYWDIGKQTAINVEFATLKKLSYDGKKIEWLETYINWGYKKLNHEREIGRYNTEDELFYKRIEPKVLDPFLDTREIIIEETEKFAEEYRQYLANEQRTAQ